MNNIETNLNSLIPQFKSAFSEYLATKDTKRLKQTLDNLNVQARKIAKDQNKENGVWWRFFRNDTGANTPDQLLRNLEAIGNKNNIKYYEECMEIAIKPETEMQIYFS